VIPSLFIDVTQCDWAGFGGARITDHPRPFAIRCAQVAAQLVDAGAGTMARNKEGRRPFEMVCGGGEHYEALPRLVRLLRPKAPTYE
jgi:hypothetical protein